MKIDQAIKEAIRAINKSLASADGDELTILREFSEEIGSVVDGWSMRIFELEQELKDND